MTDYKQKINTLIGNLRTEMQWHFDEVYEQAYRKGYAAGYDRGYEDGLKDSDEDKQKQDAEIKVGDEVVLDIYDSNDRGIVTRKKWFKESGLIWCDIDGWYISEDGTLALVDDCGKVAYPPIDRFDIVYDEPTVDVLEKIRTEIAEYGSIWVAYAITDKTKTDKGIENLVSDVLKQAKEQVLEVIDKYR